MALVSRFHLIKIFAEPQLYFGGFAQSNSFVLLKGEENQSLLRVRLAAGSRHLHLAVWKDCGSPEQGGFLCTGTSSTGH